MSTSVDNALNDLKRHMAAKRERVDRWLEDALPAEPDCPPELLAAMRHSVLGGGKRLRPILVLLACEACGGAESRGRPPAVAVELVHAYSLVHDDLPCMDDDDLRRGRPTTHAMFGQALAVLAGDGLLTHAWTVLAEQMDDPDLAVRCIAELARAAGPVGMVAGQARDLLCSRRTLSTETVEDIHRRKTGALIRAAVRMGALVAGADGQAMDAVDRYGRCIGQAFQIADDLLGRHAAEATLGKPVGKDTVRGKPTLPAVLGVEASRQRAQALVDEACARAAVLGAGGERLSTLARYVIERNR